MNRLIKYFAIALTITLMGCSSKSPLSLPAFKPTPSGTQYSNIKNDINDMIAVFRGTPIRILVDRIENRTKEQAHLPTDISDIVNTSFNEIGKNVVTIANHNMIGDKMVYIIHGAITEYDVTEERSSGRNYDVEAGKGKGHTTSSGGLDKQSKITRLAINFNPEDIKTGNFVSRASTANKITIYQKSNATEFGFSIFGSGFGYNKTITKSQGIHSSIAVLVDLSVAEVLGKIVKFPYWILTKGEPNRVVLNSLTDSFLDNRLPQKLYKISYLLALKGESVQVTNIMTPNLKRAIIKYKKAHGIRENLYLSQEFYRSLLGG